VDARADKLRSLRKLDCDAGMTGSGLRGPAYIRYCSLTAAPS
jgi:hypothetical protein